ERQRCCRAQRVMRIEPDGERPVLARSRARQVRDDGAIVRRIDIDPPEGPTLAAGLFDEIIAGAVEDQQKAAAVCGEPVSERGWYTGNHLADPPAPCSSKGCFEPRAPAADVLSAREERVGEGHGCAVSASRGATIRSGASMPFVNVRRTRTSCGSASRC